MELSARGRVGPVVAHCQLESPRGRGAARKHRERTQHTVRSEGRTAARPGTGQSGGGRAVLVCNRSSLGLIIGEAPLHTATGLGRDGAPAGDKLHSVTDWRSARQLGRSTEASSHQQLFQQLNSLNSLSGTEHNAARSPLDPLTSFRCQDGNVSSHCLSI